MYRSRKEYVDAPGVEEVAEQVVSDKGIDVSMCEIKYVKVYPKISNTTAGRCKVANNREHHLSGGADYIIEMSGDLWDSLDDERRYVLTWHEIMHIAPEYSEKKGEYNYKVRRHDVEDFQEIIDEHGAYWFDAIRDINASVNDLDPAKASKLSA